MYPHVTDALPFDADSIPEKVLAHACQRGTYVHKCTELIDAGSLNWDALDPQLLPYCRAYVRFIGATGCEILRSEFSVVNERHGYVGTSDREVTFGKLVRKYSGKPCVLEIKATAQIGEFVGQQLAAYAEGDGRLRAVVQLKRDETYVLKFYESPGDFMSFLNLLREYKRAVEAGEILPRERT